MSPGSKAIAWALVAIVLWGTLAAVVGDALRGVPFAGLLFWSLVFAAPTLAAADFLRGRRPRDFLLEPKVLALGLWGIFGYHALFFAALDFAPIVQANLLNYLWPLLMVLLAAPLAKERPSGFALAGAMVGFGGAVLVVTQGRSLVVKDDHLFGYALALLAALSWSSFSVLLRRFGARAQGKMAAFALWSLAASFALALALGDAAPPPGRALAAAAWVGIGPMALAFLAWDRAMTLGRASTIGALSYLDLLLSTICVAAVLRERLSGPTIAGMFLIILGAAAPTIADRRKIVESR